MCLLFFYVVLVPGFDLVACFMLVCVCLRLGCWLRGLFCVKSFLDLFDLFLFALCLFVFD